jgi:hypothetical protein
MVMTPVWEEVAMNRLVRSSLTAATVSLSLLLTGCGGDGTPEVTGTLPTLTPGASQTPSPSASPTASASSDVGVGDTACLEGRWGLDVADYGSQSATYIKGLGVPLGGLEMSGTQIVGFRATGDMSISTDLRTDAVVAGVAISASDQSAGSGEWGWNEDSTLQVDEFSYTVEPTVPPAGAPYVQGIDWTQPITVVCDGDRLELRGSTAPLTGRFTRL